MLNLEEEIMSGARMPILARRFHKTIPSRGALTYLQLLVSACASGPLGAFSDSPPTDPTHCHRVRTSSP
jgi:hypothetical protein